MNQVPKCVESLDKHKWVMWEAPWQVQRWNLGSLMFEIAQTLVVMILYNDVLLEYAWLVEVWLLATVGPIELCSGSASIDIFDTF